MSQWLVALGGSVPDRLELLRVISEYREGRLRLLKAGESCSARQYAEAIAQFHRDGSVQLPNEPAPPPQASIPIALVGAHLPVDQRDLLDSIERCGGRIVLNATTPGERDLAEAMETRVSPDLLDDPAEVLTRRYFRDSIDAFHRPNSRLYLWLKERLLARRAKGIMLWSYVNCDLWRAEAQTMREVFGLPVCLLEEDGMGSCSPRNLTRIQAFLELLG